jgi:hypothetical protein
LFKKSYNSIKGGWWQNGVLSDQSADELVKELYSRVVSHFTVYKTFAKTLALTPGSTYTFITGAVIDVFEAGKTIYKDSSLLLIGSYGTIGVYNAAFAEFYDHPNLRVSQLRIGLYVKNISDSQLDKTNEHVVGSDFCSRFVVKIINKHMQGVVKMLSRSEAEKVYEGL